MWDFFKKRFYVFIFRERGRKGKKEGEEHRYVREASTGPGPQPRHVPCLGIKPVTFRLVGWTLTYWVTPVRATCGIFIKEKYFWITFVKKKERKKEWAWCFLLLSVDLAVVMVTFSKLWIGTSTPTPHWRGNQITRMSASRRVSRERDFPCVYPDTHSAPDSISVPRSRLSLERVSLCHC